MNVYVIITPTKVHTFTGWARAMEVYQRAQRMGARGLEFVSTEADRKRARKSARAIEREIEAAFDARCNSFEF